MCVASLPEAMTRASHTLHSIKSSGNKVKVVKRETLPRERVRSRHLDPVSGVDTKGAAGDTRPKTHETGTA